MTHTGTTVVFIAYEHPTCVHVTVQAARNARSAAQLARNYATKHYGMTVGHYVSSGGTCRANGEVDYTFVYSAPDLVAWRTIWESTSVSDGRVTGVVVFASEEEAREHAARSGARYVRGPLAEYRRPKDIPVTTP